MITASALPESISRRINDAIEQHKRDEQRELEEQERQHQEQIAQARTEWEAFKALVIGQTEDELRPYLNFDDDSDEGKVPDSREDVVLRIPGCAPIYQSWQKFREKFEATPLYQVHGARLYQPSPYDDKPDEHRAYFDRGYMREFDNLDHALVFAVEQAQKLAEYEQRAEQANEHGRHRAEQSKNEQREREEREEREAMAKRQAQAEADATQKRDERLLDLVQSDPMAATLLRLFIMINEQRVDLEERVDIADHWLAETESHYHQRINSAREEARQAERRASDESRRAADAEYELSEARRKIKQGL